MQMQVEAERKKRAAILQSEGKLGASVRLEGNHTKLALNGIMQ